ncbi:MAG TPA: Gfo/Idh/MocA family oxidoreductase [Candidatus Hydrogenedentes bacterium]|nr:Gfo/Idh/MocA family oxidoreductase [Candidatus Hydrogenedentota bacterium]HNT86559.1 Gfo/Idh/MocA family oxidoreductase [Candidatus Hydrogenedentota bacterium]
MKKEQARGIGSAFSGTMDRRGFLASGAALLAAGALAAQSLEELALPEWTSRADKKVRIGVVGGRFGLSFHWHEHPNCIVEAVSDLIPDRRAQLQGRYECEKAYESLEKLVLDPKIDAVAVFTPAPDHARHVKLCMDHGKHVISACPACMTLEEAAMMKEVKERTGLKYMNAETSYYRWETITARRLFARGDFGEMVYSEGEYYHPLIGYGRDALSWHDGKKTWRYGFPPMLYPTHSTAFLVGVTGERLTKVSCVGLRETVEPAFQDNVYNNPFTNGMAMFLTDKGHPFRCNVAWNIHAHGERAQWLGSRAALYMEGPAGQPFAMKYDDGASVAALPDYWREVPEKMRYDKGHGRSHAFITAEFIDALVEDREPAIDLYESLAFCVPGIVAHQSSFKDGEQLDIPSFDRM